jgi:HD-GYP domain-containing protein (c-di-GMP phosphodiesterase class II)
MVDTDPDFRAISVTFFLKLTGALPMDVFIRRAEKTYSKLFKAGDPIDHERVKVYTSQKGVQTLFVHVTQYEAYLNHFSGMTREGLQNLTPANQNEVVGLVCDMAQHVLEDVAATSVLSPRSAEFALQTVRGCLALFAKDPSSMARTLAYIARHPYGLRHSVTVMVFSLLLARANDIKAERSLMAIGIGALFHDAGMGLLPPELDEKQDLTPQEWKEMKTHPQLGAKLLDRIPGIPEEARLIVMQHHEQSNGQGYPDGLGNLQIYPPAKFVAVADAFAALISERPFRPRKFTAAEAIEILRKDQGKFDRKQVDKLAITILGAAASTPSG